MRQQASRSLGVRLRIESRQDRFNISGSLAKFVAMRRASSRLNPFIACRRSRFILEIEIAGRLSGCVFFFFLSGFSSMSGEGSVGHAAGSVTKRHC